MKNLTLFSILILLVLLTAAWAPSALPALQPAAGQAAAAQQAATGTPRPRPRRSRRRCLRC